MLESVGFPMRGQSSRATRPHATEPHKGMTAFKKTLKKKTAFSFFQTLLSRALQGDGWLATVSDAPLPLHFIGGASVAHHYTSGHGTAVASADTSTTIFEVGRRRTPPVVLTSTTRTWLSGPGRSS
ncbi:hypothetical protein EVAR_98667_1 [Eumeta japonica]|uniref:Uncharacterized protein n=1 Tax=Eumeta variegata TaxID=151549 RepID=A0A4C1XWY7_EUMVA|nr:hypothetical protein EVAR_98667_1 [Eumeta japonica]